MMIEPLRLTTTSDGVETPPIKGGGSGILAKRMAGGIENATDTVAQTIGTERHLTRQKVYLIWTGGTIASVLRSELCGPVFAATINALLEMKPLPSTTQELKEMMMEMLEKVEVPDNRLKYKEQLFTIIENSSLSEATPERMIDRLKIEFEVSVPGLDGQDFIDGLPQDLHNKYHFVVRDPFATPDEEISFGIDSTEMLPDSMERIGVTIDSILEDPSSRNAHIIVTHGTDTMANNAAYQSFRYSTGIDRPIVFTGSQIRPGDSLTDAYNNFALALKASDDLECGEILIAFGAKVSRGVAASKLDSIDKDGFSSPHQGTIATLSGLHWKAVDKNLIPPQDEASLSNQRYPGLKGRSTVVKLDPKLASNHDYLRTAILNPELHDGIVIEGYAAGNVPTSIAHIIEEVSRDMLVIIAPSGATHGEPETRYEGSPEISHPGSVFAKGMVPAVANMKFQWLYQRALELGYSEENKPELLQWVRSRFAFNYVNEFPHVSKTEDAKDFRKKSRMRHFLLHSREKIDLSTITPEQFSIIYERAKKEWLNNRAAQLNIPVDVREKWVENRMELKIPTETLFDLWNPEVSDGNWEDLASTNIDIRSKPHREFAQIIHNIDPQSKFAPINEKLAMHVFHEWKKFVINMMNYVSEKIQKFYSSRSEEAPVMSNEIKSNLQFEIMQNFLVGYVKQKGSFVFSKRALYALVCARLTTGNGELYAHLLDEGREEQKNDTQQLPEDLRELLCRSLTLITTEIIENLIDQRKANNPSDTIATPEEYAQQVMGMTLSEFSERVRTTLLESNIGQQMLPNAENGESIINLRSIRHDIAGLANQFGWQRSLGDVLGDDHALSDLVREITDGKM